MITLIFGVQYAVEKTPLLECRYAFTFNVNPIDAVVKIEKDKIESIGARNIYEAMRMVPGVYFNGWGAKGIDFGDHNTTLSVRGVDQGASVLLNGIPVAANNFTQLSSIDISSVERIEVVKGAAAVLYGLKQ